MNDTIRSSIVAGGGFLAVALCAVIAGAHGTRGQLMGTVQEVTLDHVVVRETDGHTTTARLTADTRYRAGDRPARFEDVRSNEQVVIDVGEEKGTPVARLVRMAPPEAVLEHEQGAAH